MNKKSLLYLVVVLTISACQPLTGTENKESVPTHTLQSSPTNEIIISPPILTSSPTFIAPITQTPFPTASKEPLLTASPTSTPEFSADSGAPIIIDHTAVDLFENIPDDYILAASQRQLLFRHLSVGERISWGLDCLEGTFEPILNCFEDVPPAEVTYDPKYNRHNWEFKDHDPRNVGWYDKANNFIMQIDNLAPGEFDAVSFKFSYVDGVEGSFIDDLFFNNNPEDSFPSIEDLEALESRHPDKTMIYWTMGLARAIGTPESESFNHQMREYVKANNKTLMDIADIESHAPDGSPCYDIDGRGIEAMCPHYTNESRAGHPNSYGRLRLAKAVWVLMARLSGWDGNLANP